MGKPFVAFYIFLILSVAPIDAERVQVNQDAAWQVFHSHDENCANWKTEFELRTTQLQTMTQEMRTNAVGGMQTAQVVMRLRSMTRLYERAARQECTWVQESDVDTSALQSTVNQSLGENECFPAAQALMTHQWETPQQQIRAMNLATQMLITHQCNEEDAPRLSELLNGDNDDEDDEEVSMNEQLDQAGEEIDSASDELVEGLMNEDSASSLMQFADGSSWISSLDELLGLVAFMLTWLILCVFFVPLALIIIGGVLCTMSFVIRTILGRALSRRFNPARGSLGNCLAWWGRQGERIFAPGNEMVTVGVCLLSGLGAQHAYRYAWAQVPGWAQGMVSGATGLSAPR